MMARHSKFRILGVFALMSTCGIFSAVPAICAGQQSAVPRGGYVPDESTAIRIAEAVFVPIYGERQVKAERPFHVRLAGDLWIVSGTLHKPSNRRLIVMGGTMTAEIDRVTGGIVDVYHRK